MNKKIIITTLFLLTIFITHISTGNQVNDNGVTEAVKEKHSAEDWKFMYFFGITPKNPSEIDLPHDVVGSLLGMIGANSGISTGEAIDPKYIINQKGATVWLAMYAAVGTQNPEALTSLKKNSGFIHIPSPFLNSSFKGRINWPEAIISKYKKSVDNYSLITIPFIIPKSTENLIKIKQSIKSPDGSLEIFGFSEFQESNPEHLLAVFDHIAGFINDNRPDIVPVTNKP